MGNTKWRKDYHFESTAMFKASPSMTATKPIHSDSSQESDFGIEPKSIQKKSNLQFRYYTRKKATSYGVTGWVRNTPNNKVEGEAQAEDDVLHKFMKDVEKQETDVVDGETGFEVRR